MVQRIFLILLGIALLQNPTVILAGEEGTATPTNRAYHAAELLIGREVILTNRLATLEAQFPIMLKTVPQFRKMEESSPGLPKMITEELNPIIIQSLSKELPTLVREIEALVVRDFTSSELEALITFWESPLGKKISKLAESDRQMTPMMDGKPLSIEKMRRSDLETGAKLATKLSELEVEGLADFWASEAGQKLQKVYPEIEKATLAWNNLKPSIPDSEMNAAMARAIARYFKVRK